MKKYLLINNNGYGNEAYSLVSIETGKIIASEDHLQYIEEDYKTSEIIYNIKNELMKK